VARVVFTFLNTTPSLVWFNPNYYFMES
jgi:hypothetical protein